MQEGHQRRCWRMPLSRNSSRRLLLFSGALILGPLHADEQAFMMQPLQSNRQSRVNQSCEVVKARRRLGIDKGSIDVRPSVASAEEGEAEKDTIQVGILIRKLFGIQVKEGTYSADIVLTLRWKDDRVGELVPEDTEQLALSAEAAKKELWLPDVIPTNRDIEGLEEISSATIVKTSGDVERTKRFMVKMRQPYDLKAYPFDEQHLSVVVASSKYMFDEVVMSVMEEKNYKGCADGVMGSQPWDLLGWKMSVIEETAGSLRKSRCKMDLHIRRKSRSITENTIVPELLLLFIAFTVFFLPMIIQYVVPRVATCLVCFLTMAQFSSKTATMLPDTGDLTWITVWEQCCTFLMFEASLFNAFTEIIYHKLEYKEVAEKLRLEMATCFAGLGLFFFAMTLLNTSGEGLGFMCMLARTFVFATLLFWLGRSVMQCFLEYRRRNRPLIEQESTTIEMSEKKTGEWW
mmetsp:Transcript_47034/g.81955  ORF Transcript_47034/g.81955 Transcript_47034/m.81955 type:complete len:461 (-) Transcript_47034:21-1403(-)